MTTRNLITALVYLHQQLVVASNGVLLSIKVDRKAGKAIWDELRGAHLLSNAEVSPTKLYLLAKALTFEAAKLENVALERYWVPSWFHVYGVKVEVE